MTEQLANKKRPHNSFWLGLCLGTAKAWYYVAGPVCVIEGLILIAFGRPILGVAVMVIGVLGRRFGRMLLRESSNGR